MFVEVPHGRLFYRVVDRVNPWIAHPKTVVFLHGVAVTHEMWSKWVDVLSPTCRLILIDTRGCGHSSEIGDVEHWTLDDVSDDVLAAADAADAGDIHLVGESFGGTVMLNLAARALPRVKSVAVASTAHRGGQIGHVRKWRESVEENGIAWWSNQMMERRFFPGAISDSEYTWFREIQDKTNAAPLLRKGEMLLETDLTNELSKITSPLLLLSPDRSPFVTPDIAVEISNQVKGADLAVLPHTRHGIFFSHGDACARLWLDFQNRIERL